jgi:nucleoside-diphosphate-sugar epimerase
MKTGRNQQRKLVLTGANGYIGSRLSQTLDNFSIIGCVRSSTNIVNGCNVIVETGNLVDFSGWGDLLQNVECVVHLAARAHIAKDFSKNPINEFRKTNTDVTLRMAKIAAASGVKRFVYVSSIGVLGNSTLKTGSFNNHSPFNPKEPYAVSKMEAEIGLKEISDATEMEVVVVRPPLVYGANSPGNFYRLLRLVDKEIPLPFGSLDSRKSMISLENLCDFLGKCTVMPLPNFSQFVVSDESNWTTSDLILLIAKYMHKKQLLIPVPVILLKGVSLLAGKYKDVQKITEPLVVDSYESAKIMNWSPIYTPEEGVKDAVDFYLKHSI